MASHASSNSWHVFTALLEDLLGGYVRLKGVFVPPGICYGSRGSWVEPPQATHHQGHTEVSGTFNTEFSWRSQALTQAHKSHNGDQPTYTPLHINTTYYKGSTSGIVGESIGKTCSLRPKRSPVIPKYRAPRYWPIRLRKDKPGGDMNPQTPKSKSNPHIRRHWPMCSLTNWEGWRNVFVFVF